MREYTLAQVRLFAAEAAQIEIDAMLLTRLAVWGDKDAIREAKKALTD